MKNLVVVHYDNKDIHKRFADDSLVQITDITQVNDGTFRLEGIINTEKHVRVSKNKVCSSKYNGLRLRFSTIEYDRFGDEYDYDEYGAPDSVRACDIIIEGLGEVDFINLESNREKLSLILMSKSDFFKVAKSVNWIYYEH